MKSSTTCIASWTVLLVSLSTTKTTIWGFSSSASVLQRSTYLTLSLMRQTIGAQQPFALSRRPCCNSNDNDNANYCYSIYFRSLSVLKSCTRTRTIRRGMSAEARQDDESGTVVSTAPLIDVDCNLWHKDLKPLLSVSTDGKDKDASSSSSSSWEDNDPLAILRHDAIEQANIVAVLSPSSTIAEAKHGIQALQQHQQQQQLHKQTQEQDYSGDLSTNNSNHSLPRIRTTVGIHPYHVNDDDDDCRCRDNKNQMAERLAEATQLLQENKSNKNNNIIAAIGECGLDASEGFPPLEDQIPWFQAQIQLAVDYNLPLFVHERLAHSETMDLLQHVPSEVPVIIHCFTGTRQECKAYMERGYYISFSGYICKSIEASTCSQQDDKSVKDDPVAETISCLIENLIPLDRLMIETDAPYLGFAGCRDLYLQKHNDAIQALSSKKRKRILSSTYPNLPSALPLVLRKVCDAINQGRRENGEKEISLAELARQTSLNADRFFQFGLSDMLQ